MADAMEIVCDDHLVETEFNEVLVDYLDVQRRSTSDEDSSDQDESGSGNDSDIGRAISTDIVEDGGVSSRRPHRPSHPPRRRPLPVTAASTSRGTLNASV